jgi:hypothetical protein
LKSYLLSLPERFVRSALGMSAGVARELGEVVLPAAVRRSRLYQNIVEGTLRFVIEQVGRVEGVYRADSPLANDFLSRRVAGNIVEAMGVLAFRTSPVWVLAALADACGAGRQLIPEIAEALKAQGLLDREAQFTSVDQLLDGLERTSARLADTVNMPPLDVASLRAEWEAIRTEARSIPRASLPSTETIRGLWLRLTEEASRQQTTIFETSSMLALSAAGRLPEGVRWLSASTRVAASQTGRVMATALLDHYRMTLDELRRVGYATYAARQLTPYLRAAANQFSPEQRTLTERWLERNVTPPDAPPPLPSRTPEPR